MQNLSVHCGSVDHTTVNSYSVGLDLGDSLN